MYRGSNEVQDKKTKYDGLSSLGTKDKPKTNGDMFYNKRSQYYMKLANRFYNTYQAVVNKKYVDPDDLISISGDIPLLGKLRAEVCRIPRKPNGAGKIQLMTKKEMKDKYDINSPNMADCLAMGEEIPELAAEAEPLEFDSLWG
jgi:phage terminase large subunit